MGVKRPAAIPAERAVYTVREVCQILGLQRTSAYTAISRGQIPSIRIGGQLRIPVAAIDKMINAPGS